MRLPAFAMMISVATTGCSGQPMIDAADEGELVDDTVSPHSVRDNAETAERVRIAMAEEPKVIDYLFDQDAGVALQVAVRDDGSRRDGLAGYFCTLLGNIHSRPSNAAVRIVDAARTDESGGDFSSIELGFAVCPSDEAR